MTRHEGIDLLLNVSPVETALSLTSAKFRDAIPYADLPTVFDPWACPARLLPWLATVFSVDLWDEGWAETRKRKAIADAVTLQRLKGTREGLDRYLEFVDASVLVAETPPGMFFAGRDPTREEREQWIARLPQIRLLYSLFPGDDEAHGYAFLAGEDYASDAFLSAIETGIRKTAVYFRQGVEQAATVEADLNDIWRVYLPRRGEAGAFSDDAFAGDALGDDRASEQVLTIRPHRRPVADDFELDDQLPVGPSLAPVTRRPETLGIAHALPGAACVRDFGSVDFLGRDDALFWIYDRLAIVDPSIPIPPTDLGGGFLTRDPLGVPSHTAMIRVSAPHRDAATVVGIDAMSDFLIPSTADERFTTLLRAIETWRRRSDVILVDTQTVKSPAVGDTLLLGTPILLGRNRGL